MPHMTKPTLSNIHVHLTETNEICWHCSTEAGEKYEVGPNTLTLRDPDLGIIACPRCAPGKNPVMEDSWT